MVNTTDIQNSSGNPPAGMEGIAHIYCDHANEDEAPHLLHQLILEPTISRHGADHTFPIKLHYMLGKIEEDGLSHVVSWQPHGRCFLVHDQKEFVERVLKCWFRQSKFASFQRQLNLYGFRRLTTGRDKGGYYHEYFLRSKQLLAHRILRTRVKGTGTRKPSSPDTEPNFYLMHFLPSEPKQSGVIDTAVARFSLRGMLPAALEVDPQSTWQPQQAESQFLLRSHQAPQTHHHPTLCLQDLSPSLPPSVSQTSNVAAMDVSTIEPSLALLTPLMPYMMPNMNSSDGRPSTISNNNDAQNNYEAILSMMACGNNNMGLSKDAY